MGTDIHLHLEIKVNGIWQHYAAPSVARDYQLFGILAGVRREELCAFPPKGIPEDCSVVTKLDYDLEGCDVHTPSWLSSDEIVRFEEVWAKAGKHFMIEGRAVPDFERDIEHVVLGTYLFGNSWAGWKRYPSDNERLREVGVEDVRWVFWFDN